LRAIVFFFQKGKGNFALVFRPQGFGRAWLPKLRRGGRGVWGEFRRAILASKNICG